MSEATATRVSDSRIDVSWTSDGAISADVYRSKDDGSFAAIATVTAPEARYADTGVTSNARYRYRVTITLTGGGTQELLTGYAYTTPAAPYSISLSRASESSVTGSISSASSSASDFLYCLYVDGEWSEEVSTGGAESFEAAASGAVRARARAKAGDLYSAYTESNALTAVSAPLAPAVGRLDAAYPLPSTVTVSWELNHPDGSAQTAAQVEVTAPDKTVSTVDVDGGTTSAQVTMSAAGQWSVRVRTKGLSEDWGAWSDILVTWAENAPTATITSPAGDGDEVTSLPVAVEWDVVTVSGVSAQVITLSDAEGRTLYSQQVATDARSFEFSVSNYMPKNAGLYGVAVDVTDGRSLKVRAERSFSTDFVEPAAPGIEVNYDRDNLSASIDISYGIADWRVEGETLISPEANGTSTEIPVSAGFTGQASTGILGFGTLSPTKAVSVVRITRDGAEQAVSQNLKDGYTVVDRLPPLNDRYSYLVTAYSASGTATSTEVDAYLDSGGAEAFNFGNDASIVLALLFDADSSEDIVRSGETFHFALGPNSPSLPMFYPDGDLDVDGSHSYAITDVELYRRARSIARDPSNAVCWFRDAWGSRARVKADFTLSYAAAQYMLWKLSAKLTEVVWEEPVNG